MKRATKIISWSLYDFANTIFSMNIISLYFALWITVDMGGRDIFYSVALSISMLIAAILEPILGTLSDIRGKKIPFLIFFTLLCCSFTALLGVVDSLFLGLVFFGIANIGYQLGAVFYSALLPQIAEKDDLGRISGCGVGFGYMGTIIGLVMVKPFVDTFGRQGAFIPTGVLFLLFALPCFFLKEKTAAPPAAFSAKDIKESLSRLINIFRNHKSYPGLLTFMCAAFIFMNAINTGIVFMSVYSSKVIGFLDSELHVFYLVCAGFAILGSFLFGYLTDRFGPRRVLSWVIFIWVAGLTLAAITTTKLVFWIVGPIIGIALGSTWTSSRALVVHLSPPEKIGEVFGLFSFVGKLSTIAGLLVWGLVVLAFDSLGLVKYRIALSVQILFMLGGYYVLRKVPRNHP